MSIHYFYGLAANPFTLSHQKIIEDILAENPQNVVYVALTDHDYKKIEMTWELRRRIVEANLKDYIKQGRVRILRQTKRTYRFLSSLHDWMDWIVVGEDEWKDLKAGKWHHSAELLNCWKWRIVPRPDGADAVSSTKVRELLGAGAGFDELKSYISKTTWDILFAQLTRPNVETTMTKEEMRFMAMLKTAQKITGILIPSICLIVFVAVFLAACFANMLPTSERLKIVVQGAWNTGIVGGFSWLGNIAFRFMARSFEMQVALRRDKCSKQ